MLQGSVAGVDDPYRLVDGLVAAWGMPARDFGGGGFEHERDCFDVAADAL